MHWIAFKHCNYPSNGDCERCSTLDARKHEGAQLPQPQTLLHVCYAQRGVCSAEGAQGSLLATLWCKQRGSKAGDLHLLSEGFRQTLNHRCSSAWPPWCPSHRLIAGSGPTPSAPPARGAMQLRQHAQANTQLATCSCCCASLVTSSKDGVQGLARAHSTPHCTATLLSQHSHFHQPSPPLGCHAHLASMPRPFAQQP